MANNDKQIVLGLDIPKTAAQIDKDIKKLQGQLAKVKATGALDTAATVKEINAQIAALQSQLLADRQAGLQECMKEISKGINSGEQNEINDTVKETEGSLRGLAKLAASFKAQMAQAAKNITKLFSVDSVVSRLITQTQKAVSELKEIDTLLTDISITNDRLSESDLSKLGDNSFAVAAKYGKAPTDYLAGVQEASRARYKNAEDIAELSVAVQSTGSMTAELANQYIYPESVKLKRYEP